MQEDQGFDPIEDLAQDWYRSMRATNIAVSTIGQYRRSVDRFVEWLGEPTPASRVTRKVLVRYFAELSEQPTKRDPSKLISASYVSLQYRGLQQFWRWLTEVEQEIQQNPFKSMKPPRIPDKPVPILTDDQLRGLVAACNGNRFEDRRDAALIRVLLDTGLRSKELAGIELADLDTTTWAVTVLGKGRRSRQVPIGDKTVSAVRRYLRARNRHPRADHEALWLGSQGPMTVWGVRYILDHRSKIAGIKNVNPHRFRHTFAHTWLSSGQQETDLMRLTGWKSRQMVGRYAASTADERAMQAHQRAGLGDRI